MAERNEEELKKIIERLREKTGKFAPPVLEKRVADIKARVEGVSPGEPMDFRNVSLIKYETGFLSLVGAFYSRFEKPLARLAAFLSKFPVARVLRQELAAADMNVTAEAYLVITASASVLGVVLFMLTMSLIGFSLGDYFIVLASPLAGVLVFVAIVVGMLLYPSMRANSRAYAVERELPFALRQLSTQLRAGVSFHRALASVATADYGLLSEEMKKVLKDLDRGATLEEALTKLSYRIKSTGLRRTVAQIVRVVKLGGSLSEIITEIAEDISFEARMKIRDFTEKLNMINVVYIMIAVVAPVTITILAAIMQLPMFASSFPAYVIPTGFLVVLMGMGLVVYVTKKLEPPV